jgi:hypothetical protein
MLAMEKGREMLAELSETVQDVAAETDAELREARIAAAGEVIEDVAPPAGDPVVPRSPVA